jgi:glycosyltransferase involved in cell wall biosynthesis
VRCPGLSDLPPPPPGKTGWPWTEECPQLPDVLPDGRPWPRISIVTPNYNYGRFIEETIRSVLLQGYPALEFIVVDGGSTDESVEIITKYSGRLSYWSSEADRGQSHAINKGFRVANGEIIAWLNSDDRYLPGALAAVAAVVGKNDTVWAILGDYDEIDPEGTVIRTRVGGNPSREDLFVCRNFVGQPAAFFKKTILDRVGYLDESLHFAMDLDLFIRLRSVCNFEYIPCRFAQLRMHSSSKTISQRLSMMLEIALVCRRYWGRFLSFAWWRHAWECHRRVSHSILLLAAETAVISRDRRAAAVALFHGCRMYPFHVFTRLVVSLIFRLLLGNDPVERIKKSSL